MSFRRFTEKLVVLSARLPPVNCHPRLSEAANPDGSNFKPPTIAVLWSSLAVSLELKSSQEMDSPAIPLDSATVIVLSLASVTFPIF